MSEHEEEEFLLKFKELFDLGKSVGYFWHAAAQTFGVSDCTVFGVSYVKPC